MAHAGGVDRESPTTSSESKEAALLLGHTIHRNRAEIERRWLEQVQVDLDRAKIEGLEVTRLRDGLPDYLEALVIQLCGKPVDQLEPGGEAIWSAIAREHGVTRVSIGFDISELVHEFVILRHVIRALLQKEGFTSLGPEAVLEDVLDAAVNAAVRAYMEARDYQARQKQAEQIGFIIHELRNPLSSATVAAARLRRNFPAPDLHAIEVLERSHRRLGDLIDSVLLTEQLEAGRSSRDRGRSPSNRSWATPWMARGPPPHGRGWPFTPATTRSFGCWSTPP
jgi:signal transduction histidine kinase